MKKLFYVLQLRSDNINISGRESGDQTAVAEKKGSRFAAAVVQQEQLVLFTQMRKKGGGRCDLFILFYSFFLVKM